MATYKETNFTYTSGGITRNIPIKYFKTTVDELSIYGSKTGITAQAANNAGIYGVNGTFFHLTSNSSTGVSALQVYGVAINNGTMANINRDARGFGGTNNHSDLDSFMFGTTSSIGGCRVFLSSNSSFPFDADGTTITQAQAKWAIGGHSLRLTGNYTSKSAYINSLSSGAQIYNPSASDERTFIGATASGTVYLCTVTDPSCNFYDEYKFLKSLGCTLGLNLDGGGSSMISHKNGYSAASNRALTTIVRVNY